MQRRLVIVLAALVILLAGALLFVLVRGRSSPSPAPVLVEEAGGNAANPYQAELECIDRVIQRHDMEANEVQPALASCRGDSGNQSSAE